MTRHIRENESDNVQALTILKKLRQKSNENIQIFGERILEFSEDAFEGHDMTSELIQRQLIDFFIDGLQNYSAAEKIIRDSPTNLEVAIDITSKEQKLCTTNCS